MQKTKNKVYLSNQVYPTIKMQMNANWSLRVRCKLQLYPQKLHYNIGICNFAHKSYSKRSKISGFIMFLITIDPVFLKEEIINK